MKDHIPHLASPVTLMTLFFTQLTLDAPGTLPDASRGLRNEVLFVVDGVLKVGYYHPNGNFYTYSGRERFRAAAGCCQNRRLAREDPGDGVPTHWCYFPTTPHPDFLPSNKTI